MDKSFKTIVEAYEKALDKKNKEIEHQKEIIRQLKDLFLDWEKKLAIKSTGRM